MPLADWSVKVRSHQMQMKCYARMIYMLSLGKDVIDNPVALFMWIRRRELSVWRAIRANRANHASWKIWTLADIRAALTNQELKSDKSETTMEDKLIVVVCGYPELYNTTSYFYKNRNKFCNETGAACRSPSHDANSRLLCSEFHARMKRISRANEASKL